MSPDHRLSTTMMKKLLFITFLFIPAICFSEMVPEEIIKKVDEVRSPQIDYTTTVQVKNFSASGEGQNSTFEVLVKGSEKTVIKTILPEVERGRVLLMRDRNLWAFFPNVSKPLRLSMQERLTGQVSNGDIARVNLSGDYTPKLLRKEKIGDNEYFVVELIAKTPDVTYGKAILWAQVDNFWPLKAEFYAFSGRLIKICSYDEYKMLPDIMRPTRLVLEDPIVKGKKSIITYDSITIEELPEKYFLKDYMKKLVE